MTLDLSNEQIAALGIALAAITTTVTASLLTLVYSRELRTALTRLGVLPPVTRFQRYVRPEPGPRLGDASPTELKPTPNAAHNARREHHQPQPIPTDNQRNVRAEDQPDLGPWFGEALTAILEPMVEPFRDLHPNLELPDAPVELNPVPSYEVRDPRELPRARPRRPPPGERNSIPFPTTTGTNNRPFIFSFGAGLPEDTDADSDTPQPGPSQRRRQIPDPAPEPDPFADPCPDRTDDDPFNARGSDYEWPELQPVDRLIFGPHRSAAWDLRSQDLRQRLGWPASEEPRVRMDFFLAVESGDSFVGEQTNTRLAARLHANRDRQLYPPRVGHQTHYARPRTISEQVVLEADLCALAHLDEEWRRERGI
ncbi:hypothetical protein ARMGADRAFT_1089771 [Armillaria gallica]|uniref:Uncharacterized protein n=1 Tax=Armillaria gallica TaxID=47427 RepID=A0A2H3CV11_ARMGA|nr:hypothetical protein ARMGADRAFT_1089771 [Armillaria gallica]